MTPINSVLVPTNDGDDAILLKMMNFGIFTPNEAKVKYHGSDYYCVADVIAQFNENDLVDDRELKVQYLKICSFAFLFNIGHECIKDKYGRLIPINLTSSNRACIFQNMSGIYDPPLVSEIVDEVYHRLDKLEEYNIITNDQKEAMIERYQDQLDFDDLILKEEEFGRCCCCGGLCNPHSQTCGACPRNGRLILSYLLRKDLVSEFEDLMI